MLLALPVAAALLYRGKKTRVPLVVNGAGTDLPSGPIWRPEPGNLYDVIISSDVGPSRVYSLIGRLNSLLAESSSLLGYKESLMGSVGNWIARPADSLGF